MCASIFIYMYIHICVYMYTCTYIHIYMRHLARLPFGTQVHEMPQLCNFDADYPG